MWRNNSNKWRRGDEKPGPGVQQSFEYRIPVWPEPKTVRVIIVALDSKGLADAGNVSSRITNNSFPPI